VHNYYISLFLNNDATVTYTSSKMLYFEDRGPHPFLRGRKRR